MKAAYDYEELIMELKEDLEDEVLTLGDEIQILRSGELKQGDYLPIIDWYYSDEDMVKSVKGHFFSSKEDTEAREMLKNRYLKDKPQLEVITVEKCLAEMEKMDSGI